MHQQNVIAIPFKMSGFAHHFTGADEGEYNLLKVIGTATTPQVHRRGAIADAAIKLNFELPSLFFTIVIRHQPAPAMKKIMANALHGLPVPFRAIESLGKIVTRLCRVHD